MKYGNIFCNVRYVTFYNPVFYIMAIDKLNVSISPCTFSTKVLN